MEIFKSVREYQPAKTTLAWTAVGASILTMALGFGVGGWVTGGGAEKMVSVASVSARNGLASKICATNFAVSESARAQYEELAGLSSSYRRSSFVQAQPWALLPGETSVSRPIADLCANEIAAMDLDQLPVGGGAVVAVGGDVDPG